MIFSGQQAAPDHEIVISPPDAHGKKQALIYQALKTPGLREFWVVCGTKFGKTLGASVAQVSAGIEKPDTKWRWVAPIYTQAQIAMEEYFPKILPPAPHSLPNNSDLFITIPSTKTLFEFWHAQRPSSLEGAAVHGYVFDEAARMGPGVRASARTTTTVTKGPHLYISYPFGKNWFYHGAMEAKEHQTWAIKNGKPIEKAFIHARTADNPYVDPKVIADARRELPSRLFRQFYEAEFMDDGQVFVGFRECEWGPDHSALEGDRQRWIVDDAKSRTVVLSADWAKASDYTVFFAADLETRQVVGFERFHRVPYPEQVRKLLLFGKQFKSVLEVRHDKTGVGEAIDDMLAQTDMAAQGVTFTNPSKAGMVAQLMTSLEQLGQLWIPRWPELIGELETFDLTMSPSGIPIYSAPEGKHDDCVCSLMLVNAALIDYGNRSYEIKFMEDLPKEKPGVTPLEQFYQQLRDDGED